MNNDPKTVSASVKYAKPAIWHPVVDFLLVGGASIIGGIVLIVWFTNNPEWVSGFVWGPRKDNVENINRFWLFWYLALVISYPHLLASYRILYRSKAQIAKFRWSGIYVPCILLAVCIVSLIALVVPAETSQDVRLQYASVLSTNSGLATYIFVGLSLINVVYLGWHYNLQGWRMTATFANVQGIQFSSREQRMIKSGFLAMVLTHAVLLLAYSPYLDGEFFKKGFSTLTLWLPMVGGVALILGTLGFYSAYQRTGKRIPINAITPWAASFFWYYIVMRWPAVLGIAVVVQVAHALQYLSFTNRIERNLQLAKNPRANVFKPVLLMLVLILCGYLVFEVPSQVVVKNNLSLHLLFAFQLLVLAVNIHHCFLDGEIWKQSNLEMQQTLLAHLEER